MHVLLHVVGCPQDATARASHVPMPCCAVPCRAVLCCAVLAMSQVCLAFDQRVCYQYQ
jgi:hypothetical protein